MNALMMPIHVTAIRYHLTYSHRAVAILFMKLRYSVDMVRNTVLY